MAKTRAAVVQMTARQRSVATVKERQKKKAGAGKSKTLASIRARIECGRTKKTKTKQQEPEPTVTGETKQEPTVTREAGAFGGDFMDSDDDVAQAEVVETEDNKEHNDAVAEMQQDPVVQEPTTHAGAKTPGCSTAGGRASTQGGSKAQAVDTADGESKKAGATEVGSIPTAAPDSGTPELSPEHGGAAASGDSTPSAPVPKNLHDHPEFAKAVAEAVAQATKEALEKQAKVNAELMQQALKNARNCKKRKDSGSSREGPRLAGQHARNDRHQMSVDVRDKLAGCKRQMIQAQRMSLPLARSDDYVEPSTKEEAD